MEKMPSPADRAWGPMAVLALVIREMEDEIKRLAAENEALLEDLCEYAGCDTCVNRYCEHDHEKCSGECLICLEDCPCIGCANLEKWKWRGGAENV